MPTMELVPPEGTPYVLLDEETADELAGNMGGTPFATPFTPPGAAGLAGAAGAGDERWTTYGARSGREKQLKLYRLLRLWRGGRDLGYGGSHWRSGTDPRRLSAHWVPRQVFWGPSGVHANIPETTSPRVGMQAGSLSPSAPG